MALSMAKTQGDENLNDSELAKAIAKHTAKLSSLAAQIRALGRA
jgi:hypothetical protein